MNQTSGVLYKTNGGDEAEERCIWKIGKAGVGDAVAIFTLETIYFRYCRYDLGLHWYNHSNALKLILQKP